MAVDRLVLIERTVDRLVLIERTVDRLVLIERTVDRLVLIERTVDRLVLIERTVDRLVLIERTVDRLVLIERTVDKLVLIERTIERLLVGAPRAKALGGQKSKVTGGLYNCDTTSSSCNRVELDNNENLNTESKENQWMGVTVNSQGPGGKIVTCAHRYQLRLFVNTPQESRDITGRCYVLSQDLTINVRSDEDGGNWRFCEGRARGHERFGSCQQGLSATFTRDYEYLVFGAPGAYDWKGMVRVEHKNSTLLEMRSYKDGPYEVGDENQLNPDLVPVPPNSYLGFSLDSGKAITKKGQLTVVAGAPRAHHSGEVVLLKKESDESSMLSPEYILEGEGLASSFGYDLTVVDLTGDGYEKTRP
ncbi:integrin alpha-6-like [Oncorhynchus masou masou]|uniref:integrin alpha-6-like n=1 Tax=Oncorhynchus masou masou TaxID=90313 RepID=UPI003183C9D3